MITLLQILLKNVIVNELWKSARIWWSFV